MDLLGSSGAGAAKDLVGDLRATRLCPWEQGHFESLGLDVEIVESSGANAAAAVVAAGRGRERETPAGGGIPREKGNMTDERIDPIGSVRPEPTCTECRCRPRWAGSLWCEPCYVRLWIMDGTAAMARLGESAS